MIIIADNKAPIITLWRGDISANTFEVHLTSMTTRKVTDFGVVYDTSSSSHTISFGLRRGIWDTLPSGEYEFTIKQKDNLYYRGLIKKISETTSYSYDTDDEYTEYRE